jgi:hypothetical protein
MKIKYSTRFTCFGKTTARSFNIGCYPAAVKQGSKVDLERGNSKLHEVLEKGEFYEALLAWLWNQKPRSSNSQEASISSPDILERKSQFINILYPFWM